MLIKVDIVWFLLTDYFSVYLLVDSVLKLHNWVVIPSRVVKLMLQRQTVSVCSGWNVKMFCRVVWRLNKLNQIQEIQKSVNVLFELKSRGNWNIVTSQWFVWSDCMPITKVNFMCIWSPLVSDDQILLQNQCSWVDMFDLSCSLLNSLLSNSHT